jgi:dihydroorotate dehydrogenase
MTMLYSLLFKLIFTRFDPENVHYFVAGCLKIGSKLGITKLFRLRDSQIRKVNAFGHTFSGPFGLAAGFDKNGELIKPLADLGFSHIEVGTVTAIAQPGNEKPRLFRLTQDRALINRMGFNNHGASALAARLTKLRATNKSLPIIGVNIGKSKVTPIEDAVTDYETSAKLLAPLADYLAVNVSSPNTPGLRSLQDVESLKPILEAVLKQSGTKPVLVKIAPDLADEDVVAVAELAISLGLAGVIATNTTISRAGLKTSTSKVEAMGAGGLSGLPVRNRSLEVLDLLNRVIAGRIAIISVGGVETTADVAERLKRGATLVQGYTGFIYQGPFWARKINRELVH